MKCYRYGDKRRTQQKFDPNISFIKYGKPIKIYDYIQEQAEDCNIYKNLEKYGSIENAISIMSRIRPQIIADFEECMDLRSIEDKRVAINNIWEQLPVEEKAKFDNNFSTFIDNGFKHYTEEMKKINIKINEEITKAKTQAKTQEQNKGGENGSEK